MFSCNFNAYLSTPFVAMCYNNWDMVRVEKRARPLSLKLVVLYKAALGLVEVVFGASLGALAFGFKQASSSSSVQAVFNQLVAHELSEDPNDLFIHWLLTHNLPIELTTAFQVSLVVLVVGVVKLIIAYGIWKHSYRAQVITLTLVAVLGIAGTIDTVRAFSWFKAIATSVDYLLFYYLAVMLPRHLPLDRT